MRSVSWLEGKDRLPLSPEQEVVRLRAENERLRAALTAIREASVSGHMNDSAYTPVKEFIRRELTK